MTGHVFSVVATVVSEDDLCDGAAILGKQPSAIRSIRKPQGLNFLLNPQYFTKDPLNPPPTTLLLNLASPTMAIMVRTLVISRPTLRFFRSYRTTRPHHITPRDITSNHMSQRTMSCAAYALVQYRSKREGMPPGMSHLHGI